MTDETSKYLYDEIKYRLDDFPWRQGRHQGRTIYAQLDSGASDSDLLIGVMDTEDLAKEACMAHNYVLYSKRQLPASG